MRPIDRTCDSLVAALREAGLPHDDLAGPAKRFFCLEQDGEPAAYAGLELHGAEALLRSVVVLPARRGRAAGRAAVEGALSAAAAAGVLRAWLLTTTAAPFFARLGFRQVERATAPPRIAATVQFALLCPATAACMVRAL